MRSSPHDIVFYFAGDDLFTPYQRTRAIPIGNLTSQFFANVYLNGFDHFVKETLRCRYYIRYVDDFVVLDNAKARLKAVKDAMQDYLASLRLKMHNHKCRIHRVSEGIAFLGYRVFPTHRCLKKENVLRMRRKLRNYQQQYRSGEISLEKVHQSIQSWIGHASHANTYRLRERLLADVAFQRGGAKSAPGRLVGQRA